jgi:hypothetical protein
MVELVDTRDLKSRLALFQRMQRRRRLSDRSPFLFVFLFTRIFSAIAGGRVIFAAFALKLATQMEHGMRRESISDTAFEGVLIMPDEVSKCPLCGWDAQVANLPDADRVKCELCGQFQIVRTFLATLGNPEAQELLPYLRMHTRQASEQGEIVTLHTMNWKDFALAHKSTPFSRKVQKALELVASRCEPGTRAQLHIHADAPLVDANSDHQFQYLLHHLAESGYLVWPGTVQQGSFLCQLTPKAWQERESNTVGGIPGKCFVAMSFNDSLKDAYQSGIFLSVKSDCKMDPVRLDFVQHNEKICDKIVAEIRTCQFVVADVTLASQNVYFEAGFAMALSRPVIWTCDDATFDQDVRFDTRQYPYIRWKTPADLRSQLTDRIKATIPGAVAQGR